MKQILVLKIAITFIGFVFANICAGQDSTLLAQILPWDSISEYALNSRFGSHLQEGIVELGYSDKHKTYVYVVTERVTRNTKEYTRVSGPPLHILNQMIVDALNGEVLTKKQVKRRMPIDGCPVW